MFYFFTKTYAQTTGKCTKVPPGLEQLWPISVIPVVAEVFERVIYDQVFYFS